MLKIVVFDGGWGGETVANYLHRELQTVEIKRIIDWQNAPYEEKSTLEVCELADQALCDQIGKADLIVLGGYTSSLALEYLSKKYPEQKFVGMSINYHRILNSATYPERVTVLVNDYLIRSQLGEEIRNNLPYSYITIPDSRGWEELANIGELSNEVLRAELEPYFRTAARPPKLDDAEKNLPLAEVIKNQKKRLAYTAGTEEVWPIEKRIHSDVVLILNTNFWDVKPILEEVFGYQVRVMDFRKKLLHDVCTALNLLGLDGERSK